ncbi:MAG: hypothetical protein ABWY57_00785, partial [Mycetocola sp.]
MASKIRRLSAAQAIVRQVTTAPPSSPHAQVRPTAAEVLSRVFGFDSFRGEQQAIVDQVVAGGDAVVLMPTGGG